MDASWNVDWDLGFHMPFSKNIEQYYILGIFILQLLKIPTLGMYRRERLVYLSCKVL